jgi:hypothetical protein
MVKWSFPLVLFLLFLSPGSTVTFHIMDSGQNPLEGVEIFFCARKEVTDAGGTATFTDIPDLSSTPYGGCTLEIKKEGYNPVTDAFAVTEDMVLTYVLYSDVAATVSGVVYFDSEDNPAPFAVIRIYDAVTGEALPTELTDVEGRFSFEISVDRPVYIVVSDYEDQKFYVTFEQEQALVVNTKGIISDVEITVHDTTGMSLEGVSIRLEAGTMVYEGKTDARGKAVIRNVSNGEYTTILEKKGYTTKVQDIFVVSPERGVPYNLDVILEKAAGTLTVVVTSQSGEPVPAQVTITREGEEINRISFTETKTILLEPGIYTVEIQAAGYEPVKRQVLILEGQTKSLAFELEKTEETKRTVKVTSRRFPVEVVLLGSAAAAVLLVVFLYIRRR